MRSSTILSLVIAFVLAAAAVFGMREYLSDQKARLLAMNGMKAEERTLVVAAKAMRFGDRIRSENLRAIPWPSNETPTGSFVSIETVVGSDAQPRYAMAAIDPGEPVLSSKITDRKSVV